MAVTDVSIPQKCKAGVVVNEGPDFHVEVQMVDDKGNNVEDGVVKTVVL